MSDNGDSGSHRATTAHLIQALTRTVDKLEQTVHRQLEKYESDVNARLDKIDAQLRELSSRDTIVEDAIIRTQHRIMWRVFLAVVTVFGMAILSTLAFVVFTNMQVPVPPIP